MQAACIHGDVLRAVMRQVASPVAVVTARTETEVRGMTIGSLTSVSLAPPLLSFNVRKGCRMHEVLACTDHFVVHILHEDQAHLSLHFAASGLSSTAQFGAVPHHLDEYGVPVLEGSVAALGCRSFAQYPAGDHTIIVAEVTAVEENRRDGNPVLYFNRSYRSVGSVVALPV